jgi:hypothetical protein
MNIKYLIFVLLLQIVRPGVLAVADFVFQPFYTLSYMWSNYVGIVLNLDEVYDQYNSTTFQGYILNSNIKGNWGNNFVYTLRMPKKWYYDCAAVGVNASDTVNCKMNLKTNQTFFT